MGRIGSGMPVEEKRGQVTEAVSDQRDSWTWVTDMSDM